LAIRVHTLAKELSVKSKAIVEKCQAEGLDVKNHMSVLSAGLEATIREWFSMGDHATTQETAERVDLEKVKARPRRKAKAKAAAEDTEKEASATQAGEAEPTSVETTTAVAEPTAEEILAGESGEAAVSAPETAVEPARSEEPSKDASEERPQVSAPAAEALSKTEVAEPIQEKPRGPVKPVGPVHVPAPAVLQGPRVVRIERADPVSRPVPSRGPLRSPALADLGEISPLTVSGKAPKKGKAVETDEEAALKGKRAKSRANPRRGKATEAVEKIAEWRDRDLLERSQRLAAAADHPHLIQRAAPRKQRAGRQSQKTERIQISEPIILKDFCAATGVPFSKLFPKLMELGIPATINQTITGDQAEMLALAFDIEIEVVAKQSRYEAMVEQFSKRENQALEPRPPIVTFLGHVDHGKTSLLDRIRNARVVEGEAGGITQHIGAYRYKTGGRDVTFLDTPGHEAFTSLRARGAQITDIVVLVVAANDGVMPQTIEAMSHARAANVPIVVALNKIDLPNIDENKILGQLAENKLVVTEWGGETDLIRTSATTGQGIPELIEHLNTLAELLDLRADSKGPAAGVVIEAKQHPTRGPVVTLMVREGTLHVSDVIVAGRSYGRARAIFNDMSQVIESAGPSTPVEILGLDEVPAAGDRFHVVKDMQQAKTVAEEKRQEDRQTDWMVRPKLTLENIFEHVEAGETKPLNIIIRGDTQGSVDVLKSKLAELSNDEVEVHILHAGTGGITEGDVVLADASQAIVIGFGVVADDLARSRAQELSVQIKTYTVIYHLIDEVTQAVEGLLEPTYEQTTKGRADVRQVFRVSRVGSVAGCYVTEGGIERSSKIRVIRQNVIIREGAALESLRRFKDDAREVRQGFECGLRIAGFDDVKEGDIIEAYDVVEIARKLTPAGGSRNEK